MHDVRQWRVARSVSPYSGGTVPESHRVPFPLAGLSVGADRSTAMPTLFDVERPTEVSDKQLEALLERLDRVGTELERLNTRLDRREELTMIAHELRNLNESLQALAYAALGQQGPQVRRRRPG